LTINTIKGVFVQKSIDFPLTDIAVNFYNNSNSVLVYFEDPKLMLDFRNQMGLPVQILTINPFYCELKDGGTINVTGFPSPLNLPAAPAFNTESKTSVLMDNSNSNIRSLVNSRVSKVNYKIGFSSNPGGVTNPRNFTTDTSRIYVDGRVELPLWGTSSDFMLGDTFPFEVPRDDDGTIEWVTFRTNITNGFPIDTRIQVYFLDSVTNIAVDSLFDSGIPQPVIAGAVVDGNGIVLSATNKIQDVTFTGARVKRLSANRVNKIALVGALSTSNGGTVNIKIYENHKLNFRLGIKLKLSGNY
jgi:hypothetical protein